MKTEYTIGLLGCGVVGSEVAQLLGEKASLLKQRTGLKFSLKKIAVKDFGKKRSGKINKKFFTDDPYQVVNDPEIDIVVELMGGLAPAGKLIRQAIQNGKHVVTANKALLAEEGKDLFQKAAQKKVRIGFEASVAGAIPLLQAVSEGMIANEIKAVYGILNGTCNYILSTMTDQGLSFEESLRQAKKLGFAEADPTMDIDGTDTAHKLSILATLCYGATFPIKRIYVEGIQKISPIDISFVKRLGYRIKLLAICRQKGKGLELRVHPTMIREKHLLSTITGGFNAVYLIGDVAGETLFYGKGAGGRETASAVLSDIVAVARDSSLPVFFQEGISALSIGDLNTEYYLRFSVIDRPGVLACIAGILGEHHISINSVYQPDQEMGGKVPIAIMTHESSEKDVQEALKKIDRLKVVLEKTLLLRVEKFL
ncbi:MAG: homoserine dehydrogenase [bacterium]|nr:homoserine dehydrogenase [bacterium]